MFDLADCLDNLRERWHLAACVLLCFLYGGALIALHFASIRIDAAFFAQREAFQLRRLLQSRLRFGVPVVLSQHGRIAPSVVLLRGWSVAEPWGVWTDGAQAGLAVALPKPVTSSSAIQLWAVIAQPSKGNQTVRISAGGRDVGKWQPSGRQAVFCIPLPPNSVSESGLLRLSIDIGSPQQPSGGPDHRRLGLGLAQIEVLQNIAGCETLAELPFR